MKTYQFIYESFLEVDEGVIDVKGYNSPYARGQDSQSIDDIKYALKDIELEDGLYDIKLTCIFTENQDGSFSQVFNLDECKRR